jgi:putative ABC transport system permease protein
VTRWPPRRRSGTAAWRLPIPLNTAFETNGFRIVGTSLDYFDFRGLEVAQGRRSGDPRRGGDLGAASRAAGPRAGRHLVSAPQNLFDLDGVYPLEMPDRRHPGATGTADDEAVFVDVKTTWVISGIGHGHDDVVTADAEGNVTANAAITQFNRITEANVDSFHFHGAADSYPLTAVLVVPYDTRSGTILRGRYLDPENPVQIVVPQEIVAGLVERIFRIAAVLDAVTVIIGVAAAGAVALALFLAWQLRAPEMQTARRLGAGRFVILQLAGAEILLLLGAAALLAIGLVMLVISSGDTLVAWILAL